MSLGYLDGNTGSLIATALVGGTAGAVVAVRSARARVSDTLSRKRRGGGAESPAPADVAYPDPDAPPPADG